jgi:hypothetical protein
MPFWNPYKGFSKKHFHGILFINTTILWYHYLSIEKVMPREMAEKQLRWKHSGFSVYRGPMAKPADLEGLEGIAQYIIRSPFSLAKMQYYPDTKQVIYRSKMNHKTHRNFEVYSATDFIAAITQHIPDKGFQMVRYYGWYSNKARGLRKKHPELAEKIAIKEGENRPIRVPSRTWCELIKKIWEVDPLICPNCQGTMRIVALINDRDVVEGILKHLGRWDEPQARSHGPPHTEITPPLTYEPLDDYPDMPEEYPSSDD